MTYTGRRFEWEEKVLSITTSVESYTDYYNYTDGQYLHIVAIYDGLNNIFFVDGVKIGEVAQPISIGSNNTMNFGAEYPNHTANTHLLFQLLNTLHGLDGVFPIGKG